MRLIRSAALAVAVAALCCPVSEAAWSWGGWGGSWGWGDTVTEPPSDDTTTTDPDSGSTDGGGTPAVPEPASMVLMGLGMAGYAAARVRRRNHDDIEDES